jgi:hypothetical protein
MASGHGSSSGKRSDGSSSNPRAHNNNHRFDDSSTQTHRFKRAGLGVGGYDSDSGLGKPVVLNYECHDTRAESKNISRLPPEVLLLILEFVSSNV